MDFLNKKYKFNRYDDQYDNYLASIGLNFISRKLAKSIPVSSELVKISDNEYSFNTILPFKTHEHKFIPDQEIEHETIEGRKIKCILSFEGNKLIEKQFEEKRQVTIIREFKDNVLIGTAFVKNDKNDVKCVMWSDLIES